MTETTGYPIQTSEWSADTYSFRAYCQNCGRDSDWRQKKGYLVPDRVTCPNCECYVKMRSRYGNDATPSKDIGNRAGASDESKEIHHGPFPSGQFKSEDEK